MSGSKLILKDTRLREDAIMRIIDSLIINNNAEIDMTENGFYEPYGNGMEVAILKFL